MDDPEKLKALLLKVTGTLFRWTCELKDDGAVDWPAPEPDEAAPTIEEVGREVEQALDVTWRKP